MIKIQFIRLCNICEKYVDVSGLENPKTKVSPIYTELNSSTNLHHKRYRGGHALTDERFRDIIECIDEWGRGYA